MGSDRCCTIILSLWVSIYFLLGSLALEQDYLPPPTNFTFGMDGMFCLLLQWNPSENTANCSIKYVKSISSKNLMAKGRGDNPNYAVPVIRVDLNTEISFCVYAECNDTEIVSNNTTFPVQLATGDPFTSVRNFSCIWYYSEYVQCTWQPGLHAPPNVNYTLIYWTSKEKPCEGVNFSRSKSFHDLIPTGSSCSNYTYSNGIATGCQFKFQDAFNTFSHLVTAVSDWSKKVKPYIYYAYATTIAKLKPPVIKSAYRTPDHSIHISWNDTEVHINVLHEVLVQKSNSEIHENYKDIVGLSKEIPNAVSDVTYTVKVRARLPRFSTDSRESFIWSDWSEEQILQGASNGQDISILLLLLIPAILIVAAVILLIYMRRLKILIFPRIPDPGKVLSNDLQLWLKNGRTVYNEPRKEEICPISMLETPLTSPPLE